MISPHVKRQIDIEKRRQETELESLIKEFGERENPKFTTNEIDPLLSKFLIKYRALFKSKGNVSSEPKRGITSLLYLYLVQYNNRLLISLLI